MSDELMKAEAAFEVASKKVSNSKAGKSQGVEDTYAAAYQRLVMLGARPQLRKKYRG